MANNKHAIISRQFLNMGYVTYFQSTKEAAPLFFDNPEEYVGAPTWTKPIT